MTRGLGGMLDVLSGGYQKRDERFQTVIGKTIKSIVFSDDSSEARINFEEGGTLRLELEGDCCSGSYFTSDAKTDAEHLVGGRITKIEEVSSGTEGRSYPDNDGEYNEFSWHFLRIDTDKGGETLDWRNESNGYYDGWINVEVL